MKNQPNKLLLPRPISWSGMIMLEKDEPKWILKYLKGKKISFTNKGIEFGRKVDEHLGGDEESEDLTLQVLKSKVIAYELRKHKFDSVLKSQYGEIALHGELDTAKADYSIARDWKTGRGKDNWTQKKADEHGQFIFYATMIYLNTGKIPEFWVDWMQTEEQNGVVQYTGQLLSFKVEVTHLKIIKMKSRIIKNALRIDYLVQQNIKSL